MVRTLLSQSPEAMIITGGEQTDACQRMLKNARVPVVQMMELLSEPLDMNVGFSHHQAGYAMAEQIIAAGYQRVRSEEHTSELQSRGHLVCRLLLEKKKHICK